MSSSSSREQEGLSSGTPPAQSTCNIFDPGLWGRSEIGNSGSGTVAPDLLRDSLLSPSSQGMESKRQGLGPLACSMRQLDWHDLQITARVVGTVR